MADQDLLASLFEEQRPHLRGVAYRILGSVSDADDAVQDTWLRLSRCDTSDVANMGGWLTTVVARVALSMLQSRKTRREDAVAQPEGFDRLPAGGPSPEDEALLGDSVGAALQVVLDTLEPRERIAFVLHDLFGVPFDEIAPVAGASAAGARQLASRARRRVSASAFAGCTARQARHREIVAAFFAAAREARFGALLELLDPDVVMRADEAAARLGAAPEATGADMVARWLYGRARGARLALVDGEPGAVWAVGGKVRVVFAFTISAGGQIARIDLIGSPEELDTLDIEIADVPR
jgi:RNA polymerase sigma factor (sigma-70 family)